MKKKNKLVVVKWQDTVTQDCWTSIQTAKDTKTVTVVSVGWVMYEDADKVTLASAVMSSHSTVCQVTCIPQGCIEDIIEVEVQDITEEETWIYG